MVGKDKYKTGIREQNLQHADTPKSNRATANYTLASVIKLFQEMT